MKKLAALSVSLFILALSMLLGGGTATAHSALLRSDPANGAQLTTGPTIVTLVFNEEIQSQFATIAIVGPDGKFFHDGGTTVNGTVVTQKVLPLGASGKYQINWRVTSTDGHPLQNRLHFELTTAGKGAGVALPNKTNDDDSLPVWPFVLAVGVVVAAGIAFALRRSQSATSHVDGE